MSVSRNNELLRANQSYSTKCFFISCPLPWVHSSECLSLFSCPARPRTQRAYAFGSFFCQARICAFFSFRYSSGALGCAYALCAYLANSEYCAQFSTNTCLLLNAKSRMANSRTSLPLGLSLTSDLLGLSNPIPISPSWQYTAFAVCTISVGTP